LSLGRFIHGIRPQLQGTKNTDYLFLSHRGRRLDTQVISRMVKHHAKAAKIDKKVTTHTWRHSLATSLLKNEAKLMHVKNILGHRSLAVTERYLHLNISDLKEAHKKYSPR
jgi:integrase/recombinase XerD